VIRRMHMTAAASEISSMVLAREAQAAGAVTGAPEGTDGPALLVGDEILYLPISRTGAMLFFQLMTRRYEQASTLLSRTRASKTGARSSGMTSWPQHSSIDSSITVTSLRFVQQQPHAAAHGFLARPAYHARPGAVPSRRRRARQEVATN